MKVIYNGVISEDKAIDVFHNGWLNGSGIFETIKTVNGIPWALSRHMRRAVNSASRLTIKLPSEDQVRDGIDRLLAEEPHLNGALRVSFDSEGNWGAAHNQYSEKIAPAHLTILTAEGLTDGVAIKTFPYTHRLELLNQAMADGFDEVVVVNSHRRVCEGAVTNLLLKIDNVWCTPPLSDGVLPGVMRALVIEYLKVQVRSISSDEIPAIQSGFLLSSLRIAQPIATITSRKLSPSHEFGDEIRALALRTSVG
jgi:branched-chain amino acid aminotransferase